MRSIDGAREKCKELEMSITNDISFRSATGIATEENRRMHFFFIVFSENEQELQPALVRLNLTVNEAHIGLLSPTKTAAASQRHRAYT